jgi:acetyl-CoA carboxylase biotin carboxyl carrier protein
VPTYAPQAAPVPQIAAGTAAESAPAAALQPTGKEIVSPMVGTFYRTPAPESPN